MRNSLLSICVFLLASCGGGGDSSPAAVQGDSGVNPETPSTPETTPNTPTPNTPIPETPTPDTPRNTPPTTTAGADMSVASGRLFTLVTTSSDAESGRFQLSHDWVQTAGATAKYFTGAGSRASYYAPIVTGQETTLTFDVTVTDEGGLTAIDSINITVTPQSSAPLREQIEVSGPINSDTTWSGDKIYNVTGTLSVRAGATLTIEEGAVIQVHHDDVDFLVAGTLVAEGTQNSPVVFTNWDKDNCCNFSWPGIEAIQDGRIDLLFVVIEEAITGLDIGDAGSSVIGQILFQNNFYALDGGIKRYRLKNAYNTYYRNTVALDFFLSDDSEIHHNYFLENDDVFISYFGSKSATNIHDNNFVDNNQVITAQEINDFSSPGQMNFYNNWWGTEDMSVINGMITDNFDDPRLMSISPTPTSELLGDSWGGINPGFNWRIDLP